MFCPSFKSVFRWERSFNKKNIKLYYSGNRKHKLAEVRAAKIQEGTGYARLRSMGDLDYMYIRSPAYNPLTKKFNAKSFQKFRWDPKVTSAPFYWLSSSKTTSIADFPETLVSGPGNNSPVSVNIAHETNNTRHRLSNMSCKDVSREILSNSWEHKAPFKQNKIHRKLLETRFLDVWTGSRPEELKAIYKCLSGESQQKIHKLFEKRRHLRSLPRHFRKMQDIESSVFFLTE